MNIELRDYIDGAWSTPSETLDGWLEDPNTGQRRGPQVATAERGIQEALAAASRVHKTGEWAATSIDERASVLEAMGASLGARLEDAAYTEAAETGVVIGLTSMVAQIMPGAFSLAAAQLREGILRSDWTSDGGASIEVTRKPWGPAACLVPWNAPAPMAAHKAANALAAGCPVIVKPPELAPSATGLLAEAAEAAGLPPGVFQLIHGGPSQGGRLVTDPRVRAVSYTGGAVGGRAVAAACAADFKPVQLELGGNNPLVVLDDASPDAVADHVANLMLQLNGQWCRALGRLILPASRAQEYLGAALDRLAAVRAGASTDLASELGPMIHSKHAAMLRARIAELEASGAKAHSSTMVPAAGNFVAPTLLTGADPAATTEEIFGPVAAVHEYTSVDEAVALANGTPFGLEGYVVSGDEERGLGVARRIEAGEVKVNGTSVMSLHLFTPRPAWGHSGFSEEGTRETLLFFTGARVVGVERFPAS